MALQTAQPGAPIGEFFWFKWVLANAMGFAVGAAVPAVLYQAIVWPLIGSASTIVAVSEILFLVDAIFGAVAIGAAQWFFLRRRVHWAMSWFLATSLGWLGSELVAWGLAVRLITGAFLPVTGAVLGVVPLVLVALPQWLILRRHVLKAGWWLVANMAGAAAGLVGYLAGSLGAIVEALVITPILGETWSTAINVGLASATAGAAIGAITGVALRRLLERPIPETLSPPASMSGPG